MFLTILLINFLLNYFLDVFLLLRLRRVRPFLLRVAFLERRRLLDLPPSEPCCLKYKRPCITVLPANIYDPKNIDFIFDQTTNIYGTIDGLVLYNDYKWESNAILNKYLDSIISNGNISVVDPHTI